MIDVCHLGDETWIHRCKQEQMTDTLDTCNFSCFQETQIAPFSWQAYANSVFDFLRPYL